MRPAALPSLTILLVWSSGGGTAQTPADPTPADPTEIKTVHMVSMCHLDIGFTDTVAGIVNKYWHSYLWQAANTSSHLNTPGESPRFVFTTHAWLLDMFFDCPSGAFRPTVGTMWFEVCGHPRDPSFGVPGVCDVGCPSPELRGAVEHAVRSGGITWHAFPSNNEPEAGDAALTRAAIDSVHRLDDKFGLPHKTVVSQRDVPGVTRGVVPLLAEKGVVAFSEGKNSAVANPAVPSPIFNWTDAKTGTSVIFMNHYQGYGATDDTDVERARKGVRLATNTSNNLGLTLSDAVTLRGFDEALVFAFRGKRS